MRRLKSIIFASAFAVAGLAASAAFAPSHAQVQPPVPVVTNGGAWYAGGIIITAAVLVTYDIVRRTTCSGDFLNLGGPGFTTRIGPNDNVLPPRRDCGRRVGIGAAVVRARG